MPEPHVFEQLDHSLNGENLQVSPERKKRARRVIYLGIKLGLRYASGTWASLVPVYTYEYEFESHLILSH